MARARRTVRQLASEAEVDIDEALVRLWDAGMGCASGADSTIPSSQLNGARRALGLATKNALTTRAYWEKRLSMDAATLDALLRGFGFHGLSRGKTLPKGALRRLISWARAHESDSPGIMPTVTIQSATKLRSVPWRIIGHERDILHITAEDVQAIYYELVADFSDSQDPISPVGIRSRDLLASACQRPCTSLGESNKYPTIELAAAALVHSLTLNHPFHNGNKRTALVSMLVLLDRNGFRVTASDSDLLELILRIAQHSILDQDVVRTADSEVICIAEWIAGNTAIIKHGERPMPWHKLKAVLRKFDCQFDKPKVGNRINIVRSVKTQTWLGFVRKEVVVRTQVFHSGDGQEVERNTINKIRKDLLLTEDQHVDSGIFYYNDHYPTSQFVLRYQKILKRLARI